MPVRAGGGGSDPFLWHVIIQPYLKSTQILKCPSESTASTVSYTYNGALGVNGGVSLAAINSPVLTPTVIDGFGNGATDLSIAPVFFQNPGDQFARLYRATAAATTDDANGGTASDRHLEGANYAFQDGHVKFFRSPRTIPYNPGGVVRPALASNGLDYNFNGTVGTTTTFD